MGIADTFPAAYGLHKYGTEKEDIQLGEYMIYRSQIRQVQILPTYEEAVEANPTWPLPAFRRERI